MKTPHKLYVWTPFGWNVLIGWDLDWLTTVFEHMNLDPTLHTCCLIEGDH